MKKQYLFAVLFATMLASCTGNQEISNESASQQVPVSFGTYVGKATTKASVKTGFAEGDAIGVFGYYTAITDYAAGTYKPDFMYNQTITKGAADWTYSPLKYWPNTVTSENASGKVSFFAYYPMAVDGTAVTIPTDFKANNVDPKITYTASTQANQVDLLWGVKADGLPYLNQTKPTGLTDKITFTFKHALARVGFKVKLANDITTGDADETTVTIDKIEFGGDLATDKEAALEGKLTASGVLNLNNTTKDIANWDVTGNSAFYSLILATTDLTSNGIFGGTGNAALTAEITNNADKYFMIIPQDFSTTKTAMRITYTVTTTDAALNGGNSAIVNKHVAEVATNFVNGKSYLYTFTIGLTSVKVDAPTITAWTDENVAVPVNVVTP